MQAEKIIDLLERYNKGQVTPKEKALVETWYLKYKSVTPNVPHRQLEEDQQESLQKLLGQINGGNKKRYLLVYAVAASLLLFLCAGVFFLTRNKPQQQQFAINKPKKSDLAPGGNKAIITLANGSTIILTGAKNGNIENQDGVLISKTADGQIKYADSAKSLSAKALVYNTAATPRGGQYQFILSDGTKVWLNSASSIKYPVAFTGVDRKVELTGEAYFEVAHNAKKPFRVISNGQTVEVLGTHFNINAYDDENVVKTTLLEGSVKVSTPAGSSIIKPGEQARQKNGSIGVVDDVDLDAAIAWKNGFFHFDDNSLPEVMRQLSRWYDVDIKYDGQLPKRSFSGEISRNVNASQLLDILSFKKIHYKINGKSIVVTP